MRDNRIADLLEDYWCAAYKQGQEHREVDDEEGSAQKAEDALVQFITTLTRERDEARGKALEEAAQVAEGPAEAWGEHRGGTPERDKIAAAIRALKEKP
jgi:hypothetical protein